MLATIKELAVERLGTVDDLAALRRAHDDYFLVLAEELNERERQMGTRDLSGESRARFDREVPNLRAALTGLVDTERSEEVLRFGAALWRFWLNGTQYRDAAMWLEQAPLGDETIRDAVREAALTAAGAVAFYVHDDVDRAEEYWQRALDLRREQDDPVGVGGALSRLASVVWRRGDFDRAIAYHEQALQLFEQADNQPLRVNELHFLGEAHRDRGDLATGERLLEQTVELSRRHGLRVQLTNTLHSLGDLALDSGDPERALERFAIALTEAVGGGSKRVQVYCVAGIAGALALRGDDVAAARLWGAAEDHERQLAFRMLGTERQRYEHLMAGPRERLGPAYDEAHGEKVGLTLEQAVAEARQYAPSP
jgi:tetratricopeptide (TPR) repeat protein